MSSGYVSTAYAYDKDNLPFDEEGNRYEPNKKELDLFREQKSNMYKGTWMICFIYGLSAVGLLGVIIFTDWGREYVYNKFLPAVLTYVLGAIIIIIYLIFSIFALVPTKIKTSLNKMPVCPDYWHLEPVTGTELTSMEATMNSHVEEDERDTYAKKNMIDLRCVPDEKVFGKPHNQYNSKQNLYPDAKFKVGIPASKISYLHGDSGYKKMGTSCGGTLTDQNGTDACNKIFNDADMYIYRERPAADDSAPNGEGGAYKDIYNKEISKNNDSKLNRYAEIVGNYNYDHTATGTGDTHNGDVSVSSTTDYPAKRLHGEEENNYNKFPLICNKIYPKLLNAMEPNGDDSLKCDVAKICGLSWSKIDCYSDVDDIGSAIM